MNRALTARDSSTRASLKSAFENLGYEVIPFKKTEEQVLQNVPKDVRLTVTASPAKGQDATVDLTVKLAGHGYSVAPHLSAQQVRDRAHLADLVARCREAGITRRVRRRAVTRPTPPPSSSTRTTSWSRCTNSTTASPTSASAAIPRGTRRCPTTCCSRP